MKRLAIESVLIEAADSDLLDFEYDLKKIIRDYGLEKYNLKYDQVRKDFNNLSPKETNRKYGYLPVLALDAIMGLYNKLYQLSGMKTEGSDAVPNILILKDGKPYTRIKMPMTPSEQKFFDKTYAGQPGVTFEIEKPESMREGYADNLANDKLIKSLEIQNVFNHVNTKEKLARVRREFTSGGVDYIVMDADEAKRAVELLSKRKKESQADLDQVNFDIDADGPMRRKQNRIDSATLALEALLDEVEDDVLGPGTCDGEPEKKLKKVHGKMYDVKDSKIEDISVPDKHQLRIAIDTIKNPKYSFLGGPSEKEAEQILRSKFGYTDKQLAALRDKDEDLTADVTKKVKRSDMDKVLKLEQVLGESSDSAIDDLIQMLVNKKKDIDTMTRGFEEIQHVFKDAWDAGAFDKFVKMTRNWVIDKNASSNLPKQAVQEWDDVRDGLFEGCGKKKEDLTKTVSKKMKRPDLDKALTLSELLDQEENLDNFGDKLAEPFDKEDRKKAGEDLTKTVTKKMKRPDLDKVLDLRD